MSMVDKCVECDAYAHKPHADFCSFAEQPAPKPTTAEAAETWSSLREAVLWNCYGVKDDVAQLDSYFGYTTNEGTDNG